MATGDPILVDWTKAGAANFVLNVTGIGDIALESFSYDATASQWKATPVGGWPNATFANGTPGAPGSIRLLTAAAPNQVEDVQGNLLAAGLEIASRAITIAPPSVVGTVTATYISGFGAAADLSTPINTAGPLGSGEIVIEIRSTEN